MYTFLFIGRAVTVIHFLIDLDGGHPKKNCNAFFHWHCSKGLETKFICSVCQLSPTLINNLHIMFGWQVLTCHIRETLKRFKLPDHWICWSCVTGQLLMSSPVPWSLELMHVVRRYLTEIIRLLPGWQLLYFWQCIIGAGFHKAALLVLGIKFTLNCSWG